MLRAIGRLVLVDLHFTHIWQLKTQAHRDRWGGGLVEAGKGRMITGTDVQLQVSDFCRATVVNNPESSLEGQ